MAMGLCSPVFCAIQPSIQQLLYKESVVRTQDNSSLLSGSITEKIDNISNLAVKFHISIQISAYSIFQSTFLSEISALNLSISLKKPQMISLIT